MKKVKKMIVTLSTVMFIAFSSLIVVSAASFYASPSASTVAPGETFYVYVGDGVAGEFSISVSNGSGSVGSTWIEPSGSFPITAGSSGTVTVTVTAIDASILASETYIGGQSTSTSVAIAAPQQVAPQPSIPQQEQKPVEVEPQKSSDNTLQEITVSEGKLYPDFKSDVTDYSVVLPKDKKSITIDAITSDDNASVSNLGEHELKLGENVVSLIVSPEDGSSENLYKIKIHVEDELKNQIKYEDKDYFIVDHFNGIRIPDSFVEESIELAGAKVPVLKSEQWKTTLVYLEGPDKTRGFYIIDKNQDGEYFVSSKFRTINLNGANFLLMDVPEDKQERMNMTYTIIKHDKEEFNGFKYNDEALKDYFIVSLRNEKGEDFLYRYDSKEKTWQVYPDHVALGMAEYEEMTAKQNSTITKLLIGVGVSSVVSVGLLGYVLINMKKKRKVIGQ